MQQYRKEQSRVVGAVGREPPFLPEVKDVHTGTPVTAARYLHAGVEQYPSVIALGSRRAAQASALHVPMD
jgi:hypothetical protein